MALLDAIPLLRRIGEVARDAAARFVELQGIDRAMALAGQAFAALLPLLIVIGAAAPGYAPDVADSLVDEFRLSGTAAESLRTALNPPSGAEESIGVTSAVLLVVAALSFTRALQRVYVAAWRLPGLGIRGNAWGAGWLVAFIALGSLEAFLAAQLEGRAGVVAALMLSVALWLLTPWMLVGGRLAWRRLLPQAAITAVGLAMVSAAAALYAPRMVSSAQQDFGVIGVGFSLLSLLFVVGAVLVVAAALGVALAEATGGVTRDRDASAS